MKILIVADIVGWAIHNLTGSIVKFNKGRHEIDVVYAHPKNVFPAVRDIQNLLKKKDFDVVHYQYWRSGTQLIDLIPALRKIPSVCTHHNHAHLEKEDWNEYFDILVSQTQYAVDKLRLKFKGDVHLIPHGIDLDEFAFIEERKDDEKSVGYIGRVLPHKNLKLVCEGAKKKGYAVKGSGYIDKPDYWNTIDKSNLEFHGGIGRDKMNSWEAKNRLYEDMSVFVMYSTNEYETGTLPLLEAMARGVPVMATEQGMARDIITPDNGVIFEPDNFAEKLEELMENRKEQERLRYNARKTINRYSEEKMAILYDRAYTQAAFKNKTKVTAIIPTTPDRIKLAEKVIEALRNQTYKNLEILLAVDDTPEYNLAAVRNKAVVDARGDLLVFCDDRLVPVKDAVEKFVQHTNHNQWSFGNKRSKGELANKQSFVENFSAVHKCDLVRIGLFNERIKYYGGMTQDIRTRCLLNGIDAPFLKDVIADEQKKSGGYKRFNDIWKSKLLIWKLYE